MVLRITFLFLVFGVGAVAATTLGEMPAEPRQAQTFALYNAPAWQTSFGVRGAVNGSIANNNWCCRCYGFGFEAGLETNTQILRGISISSGLRANWRKYHLGMSWWIYDWDETGDDLVFLGMGEVYDHVISLAIPLLLRFDYTVAGVRSYLQAGAQLDIYLAIMSGNVITEAGDLDVGTRREHWFVGKDVKQFLGSRYNEVFIFGGGLYFTPKISLNYDMYLYSWYFRRWVGGVGARLGMTYWFTPSRPE